MIKKLTGFFLAAFLSLSAQNNFNFEFDYARYAYNADSSFIEFYYSFDQNSLYLAKDDSGFTVKAILKIQISKNDSSEYIVNNSWRIDNRITDTSSISLNKNLIGTIGFILPAGEYICRVSGTDGLDSSRTKTISENLSINPLVGERIALSDIELANNILQDNVNKSSIFYKNTLEVIPNPTMVFGQGFPVLFYYLEIYNLNTAASSNPLAIKTMLFNGKGLMVLEKTKPLAQSSNSRVEVGTLNLTKYPTDSYTLAVSLLDTTANYNVSSTKRFFIYNPSIKDTSPVTIANVDFLSSQFGALSSDECDLMFEKLRYIVTDPEEDQYEDLETAESKREFLFNFWKKRDHIPATPQNEFYDEYMKRVEESNEKYGTLNRKGMKTDRGRVLILYGEPDEIDRYPNEIERKPYEIWYYNQVEGGVVFIFGDVSGFSNYELLHSTKRGELSDTNWQQRISSN